MQRKTGIEVLAAGLVTAIAVARILFSSPTPENIEKMYNPSPSSPAAVVSTTSQQPSAPIPRKTVSIDDVFVASSVNGGPATTDNKLVEYNDDVQLYAVAKGIIAGSEVYFTDADSLVINGKAIPSENIMPWNAAYVNASIKWFKVESDTKNKSYSNWDHSTDPPTWRWDKIDYAATPIDEFRDQWSIAADVRPTILDPMELDGKAVGTMRYQVVFENN